jgi:hypothetical protein
MRKFTKLMLIPLLLITMGLFNYSSAQCVRTSAYGSATVDAGGAVTTISTCSYTSEYSTVNGIVTGYTYEFACVYGGTTHKYVTLTDAAGGGNVLAHGASPFSWQATYSGTVYPNWSDDAACNPTASCHTTTVQLILGCENTSMYPGTAVTVDPGGALTTITTCNYGGEYSQVTGIVAGNDYQFTMSDLGTGTFITITDGPPTGANILAYGASPLTYHATASADLYAHWNIDDLCSTDASCHTTTVQYLASCPDPTAQTETGITQTSADLGWTENGSATSWDIELGPTGFTPTGTPTATGVTNPYTYGSLTPTTTYDWYVRADCGGGTYSAWVGPSTFTTACAPNTAFPWLEDFEGAFLPTCWSKIVHSGNDITQNNAQNHTTGGTYSARFSSFSSSSDYNQYLFTGSQTISAAYTQLSFWHRKYSDSYADQLEWGISTDTDPNNYTWTAVTLSGTAWQETTVDLSAYIGQTVYIGFHYYGNYLYYVYLDDVSIDAAPSCPDPTAQTETNITTTSADLGWTENGSATAWEIEWGPIGFTQGSGTVVPVSANPYNLGGLSPATNYDWYVRADCGGGSYSGWVGPNTFSTLCNVITSYPYWEDFESGVFPPACWSETTDNPNVVWQDNVDHATCSWDGSSHDAWFYTPEFDFSAIPYTDPQVSFDWWCSYYWMVAPYDNADYIFLISTDGGSNWTQLWYEEDDDPFTSYERYTKKVDLTSYIGQTSVMFAFEYVGADAANVYLDNFVIGPAATTWTGVAKSTDWHTASNWDNGVPTRTSNVTIPTGATNYPTITAAAYCDNLKIESDATGDGSLLDGGFLTIYGTTTVERYTTTDAYHAFSPSVTDETADMFHFAGSTGYDVYVLSHDESTNLYTDVIPVATAMDTLKGYFVWGDGANATPPVSNWTYEMNGGFNTGTFGGADNLTRTTTGANSGWNFVGNPYTSAIDLQAATGWDRTGLDATVYTYSGFTWLTYNYNTGVGTGNQNIAMGQGFFVNVSAVGTGTFKMDNDVRVHSNVGYLKTEISNIVNIQASGNNINDETSILFMEDATIGFDHQYDAYKLYSLDENAPQIYSLASTNMAVNTLPETDWVQLGFKAGVNGTYTISAEINEIGNVVLEDTFTGEMTDLNIGSYTFDYSINDSEGRFIVHFSPLGVGDNMNEATNIYSHNKTIYINLPEDTDGYAVVYDMMGKEVATTAINGTFNTITLDKSAYYVVKVLSNDNMITEKVFIK